MIRLVLWGIVLLSAAMVACAITRGIRARLRRRREEELQLDAFIADKCRGLTPCRFCGRDRLGFIEVSAVVVPCPACSKLIPRSEMRVRRSFWRSYMRGEIGVMLEGGDRG